MDMRNMEVVMLSDAEHKKLVSDYSERLTRMMVPLTESEAEFAEHLDKPTRKNWMRNKPCPCNSGRKFKKCCWSQFRPEARQ